MSQLTRRMAAIVAALTLSFTLGAQQPEPTERPFLWRIENPTPSYVYGTIHVGDDRVAALPSTVEAAIESSDAVYAELAMDQIAGAQSGAMLPRGQTLKSILPEDLYRELGEYLGSKGVPILAFKQLRPWAVSAQLALLDRIQELMSKPPLDMQIYMRAKNAGKEVGGLESVDEQLSVFNSLTIAQQVELLRETLEQVKADEAAGKSTVDELLELYLSGDEVELAEFLNDYDDFDDDELSELLMRRLVHDRNRNMAHRIIGKMERFPEKSFFFAVGAAHYPGETGIIELLQQRGYAATRLGGEPSPADATKRKAALEERQRRLERRLERTKKALVEIK